MSVSLLSSRHSGGGSSRSNRPAISRHYPTTTDSSNTNKNMNMNTNTNTNKSCKSAGAGIGTGTGTGIGIGIGTAIYSYITLSRNRIPFVPVVLGALFALVLLRCQSALFDFLEISKNSSHSVTVDALSSWSPSFDTTTIASSSSSSSDHPMNTRRIRRHHLQVRLPPSVSSSSSSSSTSKNISSVGTAFDDMEKLIMQEAGRLVPTNPFHSSDHVGSSASASASSALALAFLDKHCEIPPSSHRSSSSQDWWWPSDAKDWRLRTPGFLVIGAKKAGTTSLWAWLIQHSQITSPYSKELLYFMPRRLPPKLWKNSMSGKVQVAAIRKAIYYYYYNNSNHNNHNNNNNDNMHDQQHPTTNTVVAAASASVSASRVTKNHKQNYYYRISTMREHPDQVTFEATPDYGLFSTLSRIPILCTFPWTKLIMVLRDPVERTRSNYRFVQGIAQMQLEKQMRQQQQQQHAENQTTTDTTTTTTNNNSTKKNKTNKPSLYAQQRILSRSLEEYITVDIQNLVKAGVLLALQDLEVEDDDDDEDRVLAVSSSPPKQLLPRLQSHPAPFYGSPHEQKAWTRYQTLIGQVPNAPIGRSLYVLQLNEWRQGLIDLGRDPTTELLILRHEDMIAAPEKTLQTIHQWLGLWSVHAAATGPAGAGGVEREIADGPLPPPIYKPRMVSAGVNTVVSNVTRDYLKELFEPYNQRLYDLLEWKDHTGGKQWW